MDFRKWIENYGGAQRVASALKISPRTIEFWLDGATSPTAKRMFELLKLSEGRLSFEDVYALRTKKKGPRP